MYLAGVAESINYALPGALTTLAGIDQAVLAPGDASPVGICAPVHHLVIQPSDAEALGLPRDRFAENQIRPAASLIQQLVAMNPAPMSMPRDPEQRVVGTCRHFAVIACALLRHHGIAARVRCGFATYFQAGQGLDHWVTEYHDQAVGRWVRLDPEVLGQSIVEHPDDLRPGLFLSGSEAWLAYRRSEIDASTFGVYGTANWGPGEIRGNLVKDLAALNKVEMLPWDEWGRMDDAYHDRAGSDYDELLDAVADACAADDPIWISGLYARDELRVPPELIC